MGGGEDGGWGRERQKKRQVNAQAFSKLPFSKLPFSFSPILVCLVIGKHWCHDPVVVSPCCCGRVCSLLVVSGARPVCISEHGAEVAVESFVAPYSRDIAILSLRYPVLRDTFQGRSAVPQNGAIPPPWH